MPVESPRLPASPGWATSWQRLLAVSGAVVLLVAMLPMLMPMAAHAAIGETEPNNSRSDADALPLTTELTGAIAQGSSTSYDRDWYALDLPAAGRLTLNLTFPESGAGNGYEVHVTDGSGGDIYSYDVSALERDGKWLASKGMFLPAGRFYVMVYGSSGWGTWGKAYRLTATHTAGVVETEANDQRSQADGLTLGVTSSGSSLRNSSSDRDWYALDLAKAGRLTLNLTFPKSGAGDAYEVTVTGESGSSIYSFDVNGAQSDGKTLASQGMFLPAGRFYVMVYGSSSWGTWGKTYKIRAALAAGGVETEVNDQRSQADGLKLGTTYSGSSLRNSSSDRDWYALDLAKAGRLTLNLTFPKSGAGDAYEVHVTTDSGSDVYSFDVNGAQADGKTLASKGMFLPAGRFYVMVYGSSSWGTWGKTYTLKATSAAVAVETEVNDQRSQADGLKLGTTYSGSSLRSSSYDYDYWAIDLTKAAALSAKLSFPKSGAGSAYEVVVTDPNGRTVRSFSVTGDRSSGTWLAGQAFTLPAGRSHIRIYGSSSWDSWGRPYEFSVARVLTTATPTISGTVKVGSTLTAKAGSWKPSPTLSSQWLRDGKAIKGATKSTYKLVAADAGKTISVKVTGAKSGYRTASRTSAAKNVPLQKLTTTPVPGIGGTAKVGSTLTAKPGTWKPSGIALKYQWLRDGKTIKSATKSTYKLVASDAGKRISVKVTGAKSGYTQVAKTSKATAAVKR